MSISDLLRETSDMSSIPAKAIPQTQTAIDALLVDPENDTSNRFNYKKQEDGSLKVALERLPFKNLNTRDLTTGNVSPLKAVSSNLLVTIAIRRQLVSMSSASKRKGLRYAYNDSVNAVADLLHTRNSVWKGGVPMGGMLLENLKTKTERVFTHPTDNEPTMEERMQQSKNSGINKLGENAFIDSSKAKSQGWKF